MAHDCGLDLVTLELELVLPCRMTGEAGICSLHGVEVDETDWRLGLRKTDGDGVGQAVARARGLVGN
jgi:hypothetical protein